MKTKLFILIFLIITGLAVSQQLFLATTTSLYNSGLLDLLKPAFEKEYNWSLNILAVGTGKALKYGMDGNVDVLLVHSPQDEIDFMQKDHGVLRVSFAYNDFVVLGPEEVKIDKSFDSVKDFFRYIYEKKLPFVSRGDDSGTHKLEKRIWQSLGLEPEGKWYISTGQGMGASLMIANEKRAFILSDRGTYLSYKGGIDLGVVFEGDPALLNIYSVIVVNPAKNSSINYEGALDFVRFLLDPDTLKTMENFKVNGVSLFKPLINIKK